MQKHTTSLIILAVTALFITASTNKVFSDIIPAQPPLNGHYKKNSHINSYSNLHKYFQN